MTGASSPPARRLERPRWLDPRLLVGLLLVLASVAVGSRVVASAEEGELVWSAARDLPAGTTIEAADMQATSVRLAGSTAQYVDAGAAPPTGYVLLRDVNAGELVPAAALATTDEPSTRRLVAVPVAPNHFPPGLVRGHRVDVYVTSAATPGSAVTDDAEPELVLANASVAEVADGAGAFGPSSGSVVIVLEVDEDDAASIVAAVATGTIQLVRLPGSS